MSSSVAVRISTSSFGSFKPRPTRRATTGTSARPRGGTPSRGVRDRCSSHIRVTGSARRYPCRCRPAGERRSSAHGRSGPRSHAPIGTPKPDFGPDASLPGTWRSSTRRSSHLLSPFADLHRLGQAGDQLDQPVVEERDAALEAHAHGRPVELHQDVVGEDRSWCRAPSCGARSRRRPTRRRRSRSVVGATDDERARVVPVRGQPAVHRLRRVERRDP